MSSKTDINVGNRLRRMVRAHVQAQDAKSWEGVRDPTEFKAIDENARLCRKQLNDAIHDVETRLKVAIEELHKQSTKGTDIVEYERLRKLVNRLKSREPFRQ